MRLPGYRIPGTLLDIAAPGSDWLSVASLSLYRHDPENPDQLQTLTAIRQGATTHDEVASTLTAQIPQALQRPLVEEVGDYHRGAYPRVTIGVNGISSTETATVASYHPQHHTFPDGQAVLPYLFHDVVSRKLGVPEWSRRSLTDATLGSISLCRVKIGFSYVGEESDGTPLWEPLVLYGAAMMLFDGDAASMIPASNEKYRNIGWTDVGGFADNVRRRSVEGIVPSALEDGDIATVCARGLCLAMTSTVSEAPDLRAHLGLEKERVQ